MIHNVNGLIIHGNFLSCDENKNLIVRKNYYLVEENGVIQKIQKNFPLEYKGFKLKDFQDSLIIPGLIDMHIHAPQYTECGMNMDLELLPWLNKYIFPAEARYDDPQFYKPAYEKFVADLKKSATSRAIIFATIHKSATIYLMDLLEKEKLDSYVGKVNMDLGTFHSLCENTKISYDQTLEWIHATKDKYKFVKPILTPRFVLSCSSELMNKLGKISRKYHLPVQSHLSENLDEIKTVKERFSQISNYASVYDQFGLFGEKEKTVMAHCVHVTEKEIDLILQNRVYIAHCPQSNVNLCSGLAPIRMFMNRGVNIGLGTDLAAGAHISMFRAITDMIQISKIYSMYIDKTSAPLTFAEGLYLATRGGGSFFGKVGAFESGYQFDALILDDRSLGCFQNLDFTSRLERLIYLGDERNIQAKYVNGIQIL